MCGLEQYDGSISVDGMDISILRDKIFVVWDDTPFFENLSGYKNIRIFNDNADVDKAQLAEICKKYLPEDTLKRKVKTYSYGQKKKLALILVELLKPEILIMDEISNGLDRDLMNELQNHLQRLMENTTIVLTGHQFEFYEDIVTSVFVVKDKLVSDKTVQFKSNGGKLDDIYKEAFQ
jgi:ABC-2 type transport system ATP-binding protein